LPDLGVLAVRGPDARRFLNGQLSQEVLSLDGQTVRWAGLHTAQGRVIAVLRLVAWTDDVVLCVLPRAAIAEVRTLLARYLLRAKATLTDESAVWRLEGLWGDDLVGAEPGAARREGESMIWRHSTDGRCLRVTSATADIAPTSTDAAAGDAWHLADIAAGLPEIHPATCGAFVAQMLNLDVLNGISFTKGCYTGQEVIARAHYRGRVKRRLQRFEVSLPAGAAAPMPGDTLRLADGRGAQVVGSALRPDGRLELLAVAPYATTATAADGARAPEVVEPENPLRLDAMPLPLPYALPD
jgi:folate-binding protein YgfZ